MPEWVFLDVGNILLDEDFLTFHVFRRHVEAIRRVRPDRSFLDLIAERKTLALAGSRWPVYDLATAYLDRDEVAAIWNAVDREIRDDFSSWNRSIPGVPAMLDDLANRYRLGLIANQPLPCRDHLDNLGLLDRFSVVALSEEEGVFKPDPALFRLAIERAGAEPGLCVMVGDRVEQDILPARSLGMATIHVRWPRREEKGWDGGGIEGILYLQSLNSSSGGEDADFPRSVDSLAEIPPALVRMENSFSSHANRKLSLY